MLLLQWKHVGIDKGEKITREVTVRLAVYKSCMPGLPKRTFIRDCSGFFITCCSLALFGGVLLLCVEVIGRSLWSIYAFDRTTIAILVIQRYFICRPVDSMWQRLVSSDLHVVETSICRVYQTWYPISQNSRKRDHSAIYISEPIVAMTIVVQSGVVLVLSVKLPACALGVESCNMQGGGTIKLKR
jgi:hypothetical protein